MRPIYECPEKFRESLTMPTATFPEFLMGFLPPDATNTLRNLKFVGLPVPEIIGGTQKMGSPWIRPRSLFTQIFNGLLFGWTLWMFLLNLKFVASSTSWDNSDWSFGWGLRILILGKGRTGSGIVPFKRALVTSYRPSIVTFPLSIRVSEILPFLCSSTPLFPTPPLVTPKFSHVPWE